MIIGLIFAAAMLQSGENAISNGSFESAEGARPAGWQTEIYSGSGEFSYGAGGRSGRCVQIQSNAGGDLSWKATVPIQPNRTYRLSGWIKCEGLQAGSGRGALLNVHTMPRAVTRAVAGDTDWTLVETTFRSGSMTEVQVNCLFGGWGQAQGRAWFDDIRLEPISGTDASPTARIVASEEGEPISPYIYSQFIEHLGRCIYGGIWAEMLEDRKFLFPVTAEFRPFGNQDPNRIKYPILRASPWRIVQGAVEHKPMPDYREQPLLNVAAGGIIEQPWLAVQKGRRYEGRLVASGSGTVQVELRAESGAVSEVVKLGPLTSAVKSYPFSLSSSGDSENAALRITTSGSTDIAAVSLMPDDNVDGFRRDTLALLKRLDGPLYRWPGGNFVSGYEWRDGIGDPDRRPTRRNPAWTGIDTNDVGTHEFIRFCQLVDTEPMIVVNTGFGDPYSARQWVEYCNGTADTPMGRIRAQNGSAVPFAILWWGVGNEMFGDWQLGKMQIGHYTIKHNLTVDAMRLADPGLKLLGVGESGGYVQGSSWSAEMLKACSDKMDLISEHFYVSAGIPSVEEHMFAPVGHIRRKAEAHRRLLETIPSARRNKIKVAMDEWNYWYGPHVYGELGTQYFHKDGLGIAAGLHEFYRNSDVYEMANYAQTVNVIGAIKTSKTAANMETTGLALELYRKHFGVHPLRVEGDWESLGLDVAAALTEDRKTLTLGIVNGQSQEVEVNLSVAGLQLGAPRRGWVISHRDPMGHNTPENPERITIQERAFSGITPKVKVDPLSITLIHVPIRS